MYQQFSLWQKAVPVLEIPVLYNSSRYENLFSPFTVPAIEMRAIDTKPLWDYDRFTGVLSF